jgi:TRAP-type C4-dicarboxylate transport system substrate-binding protein
MPRMRASVLLVATALAAVAPSTARAETLLKIATLAPEGSAWMKLFHKWADAVQQRTEGRVRVKFYASGIQGDERDVIRKIRAGQLAGGAVTGIGLSAVCPEVRAFDIARTDAELDALRAALGDNFKKRCEERGFILANWGDVGPIHLFSKIPVKSLDDIRKLKLWQWNDDPMSRQLFDALGIRGVPMGVPEVLPALSTGQIDAFFGSPLSTLALQWGNHAKYMTSAVVGQASGATILSKKAWDAIPPADQKIMLEEQEKMQKEVLELVRGDNKRALEALKQRGMEVVATPPELVKELDRRGEAIAREAGKQFPKEVQAEVERIIYGMRGIKK